VINYQEVCSPFLTFTSKKSPKKGGREGGREQKDTKGSCRVNITFTLSIAFQLMDACKIFRKILRVLILFTYHSPKIAPQSAKSTPSVRN
jgi:hypothetical protein